MGCFEVKYGKTTIGISMNHDPVTPLASIIDLGVIIRDRRRALKITQTDLSEMSGIDQANISRIEAGSAGATFETLLRICQPLGIDILAGLRV